MPRTILPDNTRAMIKDPDALNPVLVAAFLDYAQARGIFVDPARIRSPKDKARVENQVPYVRESWFDGETFTDLTDARRSAEHWAREIAGARVHGTTRQVPREQFASLQKAAMLAPPTELFDVPLWVDGAKVHPDHHIQVGHALYSVPTMYLHKKVRARADKTTVRIYFGTELIKVHPRKAPGGRSTEGPLPWTRMRQAYALLRLCDKYGEGRVEAVCQSALAFDVVDVGRITRMLKLATKPQASDGNGNKESSCSSRCRASLVLRSTSRRGPGRRRRESDEKRTLAQLRAGDCPQTPEARARRRNPARQARARRQAGHDVR
jgi:hypothetical protein